MTFYITTSTLPPDVKIAEKYRKDMEYVFSTHSKCEDTIWEKVLYNSKAGANQVCAFDTLKISQRIKYLSIDVTWQKCQ